MVDTVQDLNHYYGRTVIGKPSKDGSLQPVIVREFTGSDSDPQIVYQIPGKIKTYIDSFVKTDWGLQFPKLGVFNVEDTVVYLQRIVRRQWRKSYRENMVEVHQLFDEEYSHLGRRTYGPSSAPVLESIWNPEYFSYEDAYALVVDNERLAAAMDDEFYICTKLWSEQPVLGFKNHFIGTVDEGHINLKRNVKYLEEEVSKFCDVRIVK